MFTVRGASSSGLTSPALALVLSGLLFSSAVQAGKVEPLSRDPRISLAPLDEVALKVMDPVDVEALMAEDRANESDFEKKRRVGFPMPALTESPQRQSLSPANSGTWEELPGGGRVWRLRVRSEGALWLVLGFRTFRPLPGARLHLYDREETTILGPFTAGDIRSHRQLWTPPMDGDEAVIELFWPEGLRGVTPDIVLGVVSHGYRPAWGPAGEPAQESCDLDKSLGDSGSCNVDVVCEPLWQKEKRGVVHLLRYGSSWCTASLVNNTAGDCAPYMLTARHCIDTTSEAAGTTFRFNYERAVCGSGGAPTNQTLTGSTLRATRSATDVTLLEMDDPPLADFGAYFNGWSRADTPPSEATAVHHPSGDAKKISHEYDPLIFGQNYGPDHWRIIDWDSGTTEGGSSGSPLFDTTDPVGDEPHIVGQLHGGQASCSNQTWDEYGRFDLSWTGGGSAPTRLSDWLDPLGTSPMTLGGLDHEVCLNPFADFKLEQYVLEDYRGNANDYPDPGESVQLQVTLSNVGNAAGVELTGVLSTAASHVAIPRPTANWPDIAAGGQENSDAPHFDLQIDPSQPCDTAGQSIPLTLELYSAGSERPVALEFEMPLGSPVPFSVFDDDLEPTPQAGWVYFAPTAAWSLKNSTNPEHHTSPSHSWFVANWNFAVQSTLRMPAFSELPANSRLRFQHRFETENNTDGGVLEYSLDGGANWYDINHDIASGEEKNRFLANGYTGHIVALSNRAAWEDDSGGWLQVEVDLSDFEGQTLHLRFVLATDQGNAVEELEGWYIDDVIVERLEYDCSALAQAPGAISDLRLGKTAGGEITLDWEPPASEQGGAILNFLLQQTPFGPLNPSFVTSLGSQTYTEVDASLLSDDSGFLVVGENSLGLGSTGYDSEGLERPPAQPAP